MKPSSARAVRLTAVLLATALALPAPAYALRTSQPESPTQRAGLEESLKGSHILIAPTGPHADLYQSLFKPGVPPLDLVPGWAKYLSELPTGTRVRFRSDPGTRAELEGLRELGFEPLADPGSVLDRVRDRVSGARRPALPQIQMGADGVEFLEFTFSPALGLAPLGADPEPSVGSIRVVPAGEFATFAGAGISLDLSDPALAWRQVLRAYERDKRVEVLGIPWGIPDSDALEKLMEFLTVLGEVEASALEGKLATEEEARAETQKPPEDKGRDDLAQKRKEELQARALALQGEAGRAREDLERELKAVVDAHAGYLNGQRVQQLQQGIASLSSLLPVDRALSEELLRQARVHLTREPKDLRQQIRLLPGELPEPGRMPEVIAQLLKEFPELEAPLTAKSAGMPAEDRRLAWYRGLFERRQVRQAGWSPARLAQFMQVFRQVEKEVNTRLPGLPWFPVVLVGADREQGIVAGWILSGRTRRAGFALNLLGERSNGEQTALHARFEILAAGANLLLYSDPLLQEETPELPEEQARGYLLEEFALLSMGAAPGSQAVEQNEARAESWMDRFHRSLAGRVEEGLEGNPWLSGPKLNLSGRSQGAADSLFSLRSAWDGAVQTSLETAVLRLLGTGEPKMLEWQLSIREWELAGMERKLAPGAATQVVKAVQKMRRPKKRPGATLSGRSRAARKVNLEALKRVGDDSEILIRTASMRPFVEILSEDPRLAPRARQTLVRIEHLVERALQELEGISSVAQDERLNIDWRALYAEKLQQHRQLQRELRLTAGLEESAGSSPWRFLRAVREGLEGWVEESPPVPHVGQAPDGTSHLVVLWTGAELEQDATMVSVAIPEDQSEVILRIRVRGELRFELYLPMGDRNLSPDFSQEVLGLLSVRRSDVVRAVAGARGGATTRPGAVSEGALLAEPGTATEVARQEERLPGWPRAGRTGAVWAWSLREPPVEVGIGLSSQWEWMDRALEIAEESGDREQLKRAVSEHLRRYGFARETLDSMQETLEAVRDWILLRIGDAGGSVAAGERQANVLRLFSEAFPKDQLTKRLLALADNPLLSEEIRKPGWLATAYLLAVVRATAEDETPAVLSLHQEAKKRYRVRLRQRWEELGLMSRLGGGSLFWTEARQFPVLQPAPSSNGQAQPPRFEFLASAVLGWEELVRELEQVEASEEAAIDLGFGPVSTSLEALRQRLWEDIGTWDRSFTLLYEARGSPYLNLRVEIMKTPRVRIHPVGEIGRRLRIRDGLVAEEEAGTVGALRRLLAGKLEDAEERVYFLGLPPDEVVDIERAGRDVEPITDSTRLEEGDEIFVALPDFADTAGEIETSAQALYRVPDLVLRYLGDENAEGKYSPLAWQYFLRAVERQDPEAYELLKLLPVPERYVIHGDLVVYRPTGQGLLLTGGPGAGKSLLGALLVGRVQDERLEEDPTSRWEYVANDRVDLLMFGDHLVAGPMLSEGRVRLTTRFRLRNAQRLPRRGAGGRFRFFVYQTQVPELSKLVPVRGLVWLNRRPSQRGRRDPEAILGLTRNWTRIQEVWTPLFLGKVHTLPVQEHFIGSRPGLGRFQRIATEVKRWAPYFRRRHEAGPSTELGTGLEESILLQPGERRYAELFRAGLSPEQIIAGPLLELLKQLQSEGKTLRLRVAPQNMEEDRAWRKLGLEPLVPEGEVWAVLRARLAWPRGGLAVQEHKEGDQVAGEYVELGLLPSLEHRGFADPVTVGRVYLVPSDAATFEGAGIRLKLQKKEVFLDQIFTFLSKLDLVGQPLGLVEDKETFAQSVRALSHSGVPASRILLTEKELVRRLAAEKEQARQSQLSEGLSVLEKEAAALREGLLARFSREVPEAWRPFLDQNELSAIGPRVDGFRLALFAQMADTGQPVQQMLDQARGRMSEEARRMERDIAELPALALRGSELERVLGLLHDRFGSLIGMGRERFLQRYRALLRNRELVSLGWTPLRIAHLFERVRAWEEWLDERLPGAPGFDEIQLDESDSPPSLVSLLLGENVSSPALLVIFLRREPNAQQALERLPYYLALVWARRVFLQTPVGGELSNQVVSGLMQLARTQKELYQLVSEQAKGWKVLPGTAGNPWIQVPAMEEGWVSDFRIRLVMWNGGLRAPPGTRWALSDVAAARAADLVGGPEVSQGLRAQIDRTLDLLEQRMKELPPLNELEEQALREIQRRHSPKVITPDSPEWHAEIQQFVTFYVLVLTGQAVFTRGTWRGWYALADRREMDIGSLMSLISIRSLLTALGEEGRGQRADRLAEKVLEDLGQLKKSAYAPPTNLHELDWSRVYQGAVPALAAALAGIQIPRLKSGPSTELGTGLEEAILLQPGDPRHGALYRKLFVAPGFSPLANVVEGPLRQFLTGGYLSEGFAADSRFLLRVVPETPEEVAEWTGLGLEPVAYPEAVQSHFLDRAQWPPRIGALADGTEYLELSLPAGSFYSEEDGPQLSRLRIFPGEDRATFEAGGFSDDFLGQVREIRLLTAVLGTTGVDPRKVGWDAQRSVPREEFAKQTRKSRQASLLWIGVPLGIQEEEGRGAFADAADLPADRLISEEEQERVREEARRLAQEARQGERDAAFAENVRKFTGEIGIERARQELTGSLERLTGAVLGKVAQGDYLDPAAVQSVLEKIGRLGPSAKELEDLRTQRFEAVRERASAALARQRQEIQREISELPGRALPKPLLEQVVPRLLDAYPELWRPDDKDPIKFYVGFFRNSQVAKAGWTPLRAAQFLEEVRRTKEAVLAQVPGAPWFERIHLSPLQGGVPYDVSWEPEDRAKRYYWVFVLDPALNAARIPEWAPYLTLRAFGALLLMEDPKTDEAVRAAYPNFETQAHAEQVLIRFVVQIRRIVEKGLADHPWLESSHPHLAQVPADDFEHFKKLWTGGGQRSGPIWYLSHLVEVRLAHQLGGDRVVPEVLRAVDSTLLAVGSRLDSRESFKELSRRVSREMGRWLSTQQQRAEAEAVGPAPSGPLGFAYLFTAGMHAGSVPGEVGVELVRQRWDENIGALGTLAGIQAQIALLKEPGQERLKRIEALKVRLVTELDTMEAKGNEDPSKLVRTGHWDSIYHRLLDGYTALVQGLKIRPRAAGASPAAPQSGLEELAASLRVAAPPAAEQETPLRFLADTSRGDSRVLHLLQLAVLLNIRQGLPIQAAAVATEEEADWAEAQLPEEARGLFHQLVVPYRAGDEADYQFARAVAEGMIPRFHPELAITTVEDPAVIHSFFEALQRLGVGELSSDEQERVLELLEAA